MKTEKTYYKLLEHLLALRYDENWEKTPVYFRLDALLTKNPATCFEFQVDKKDMPEKIKKYMWHFMDEMNSAEYLNKNNEDERGLKMANNELGLLDNFIELYNEDLKASNPQDRDDNDALTIKLTYRSDELEKYIDRLKSADEKRAKKRFLDQFVLEKEESKVKIYYYKKEISFMNEMYKGALCRLLFGDTALNDGGVNTSLFEVYPEYFSGGSWVLISDLVFLYDFCGDHVAFNKAGEKMIKKLNRKCYINLKKINSEAKKNGFSLLSFSRLGFYEKDYLGDQKIKLKMPGVILE